jgi:hypothetical protein
MAFVDSAIVKFIRQQIAKFIAMSTPEVGGITYDYKNGLFEKLHQYNTIEGLQDTANLFENMIENGRDAIYVLMVKCYYLDKKHRGYFLVMDSNGGRWIRAFAHRIYNVENATVDMMRYCRSIADKMGFRRPE